MATSVLTGKWTPYIGAVDAQAPEHGPDFETVDTTVWTELGPTVEDGITVSEEIEDREVMAEGEQDAIDYILKRSKRSITVPILDSRLETRASVYGQTVTDEAPSATEFGTATLSEVRQGKELSLLLRNAGNPYGIDGGPAYIYQPRMAVKEIDDGVYGEDEVKLMVMLKRIKSATLTTNPYGHRIYAKVAKS